MKVLYLTNQYPKPSHTFIRREIHGVEATGIEVERVSIRPPYEPLVDEIDRRERDRTRVLLDRGAWGLVAPSVATFVSRPVRFVRALSTALAMGLRSPRGVVRHLAYVGEACRLLAWTRRAAVDHVHAHFATNPADVALLCRALGGPPFSFTAHGTADLGSKSADSIPRKLDTAAFAVAVCLDGRRALVRRAPEHDGKVHVVHCSVDRQFFSPRAGAVDPPVLTCVARLSPEKEHATLLRAARILVDEGLEFELRLIGDGPERGALEALCRDLDLVHRVRFDGWLSGEAVREAIVESRAVVLASSSEGLPVVLMEAFALERPVVSTDVGGIRELVEPGLSGWLVAPRSAGALAAAMRAVLRAERDVLAEMGRHGAARVAELHDARAQGAKIARLFLESRMRTATQPTARARATGILAG